MNLSINGQSQVPPGFRFHPTEDELIHYYLRKKVAYEKIDLDVIREVDLNKLEPWDIQETCKIGSTPQNDWYFFSHKDKKYPTGTRTNRATTAGFWKATGRDKIIYSGLRRIGLRKTLVFYQGRAPHGQKSDWIMHEYRIDESNQDINPSNSMGESMAEDGWVVCRVFRKKNYQKALESPKSSSTLMDSRSSQMLGSSNDAVLNRILLYKGGSSKMEINGSSNTMNNSNSNNNDMRLLTAFAHLPSLDNPTLTSITTNSSPSDDHQDHMLNSCYQMVDDIVFTETETAGSGGACDTITRTGLNDWVAFDRLVASQLNGGQVDTSKQQLSSFGDPNAVFNICPSDDHTKIYHLQRSNQGSQVYGNENDLWSSFTELSSPDPLIHLSV